MEIFHPLFKANFILAYNVFFLITILITIQSISSLIQNMSSTVVHIYDLEA